MGVPGEFTVNVNTKVIRTILPKRRYLSAHFGLNYLSNNGINRDLFIENFFQKYILLSQLKKSRANFEWSVPLILLHIANITEVSQNGRLLNDMLHELYRVVVGMNTAITVAPISTCISLQSISVFNI